MVISPSVVNYFSSIHIDFYNTMIGGTLLIELLTIMIIIINSKIFPGAVVCIGVEI
jgi:hypothetical protein